MSSRKVSRFGIRHASVCFGFVIRHGTFEGGAPSKHIFRVFAVPTRVAINRGQRVAPTEYLVHIIYHRSVEIREVDCGQTSAANEHLLHVHYLRGIEMGEIEFGKMGAETEHRVHVLHL